jgi:hypothetical protein
MTHQAFRAAAEHKCVPTSCVRAWENAYHKEAQKLGKAIEDSKTLKALYEEALAEADRHKQDSAVLYGRVQELEDQASVYSIRVQELKAGHQPQKTAQSQPLSGATECFGDQTQEESQIVDMISEMESVLSNINTLVRDIQVCSSSMHKRSNGEEEDEYVKAENVKEKPRKKRRSHMIKTENEVPAQD